MNALSNAHSQRGSDESPYAGFISNVLPEALRSKTGVSSDYAVKENHQWYVLRIIYNRTQAAYEKIMSAGVEYYQPMHYILEKNGIGKKRRIKKPLFPNLVFVYATCEAISRLVKQLSEEAPSLKFYLDKTRPLDANGKHPPLVISYPTMQNFIRVTSTENPHVRVVSSKKCHYKSGDLVRIVKGEFEGIVGRVARIAGQRRVVVDVEGLGTVATAYVPEAFLMDEVMVKNNLSNFAPLRKSWEKGPTF